MKWHLLALFLASVGLANASYAAPDETDPQIVCDKSSDNYINSNPLGTCQCQGHLWVSESCREGFYCVGENDAQDGCYVVSTLNGFMTSL